MASTKSHKETKSGHRHRIKFLENPAAHFRKHPTAPVRVLVSTATHLVPGDGYFEKTTFIANVVCQHHWGEDFKLGRDRLETRDADFAFDNRTCYFLIDHGQSPKGGDKNVPILRYRWTGTALRLVREPLPYIVRKKIKRVPFTPAPSSDPRRFTARQKRKHILMCLHRDMGLSGLEFRFLRENREHARWLRRKLEPMRWSKFKSLEAESREFEERLASGIIRPIEPEEPKDSC